MANYIKVNRHIVSTSPKIIKSEDIGKEASTFMAKKFKETSKTTCPLPYDRTIISNEDSLYFLFYWKDFDVPELFQLGLEPPNPIPYNEFVDEYRLLTYIFLVKMAKLLEFNKECIKTSRYFYNRVTVNDNLLQLLTLFQRMKGNPKHIDFFIFDDFLNGLKEEIKAIEGPGLINDENKFLVLSSLFGYFNLLRQSLPFTDPNNTDNVVIKELLNKFTLFIQKIQNRGIKIH